jgi:hypothetical protein
VIRLAGRAIAAWFTSRADLIAENLCLRQQLIVLHRRTPRPRLRDGDRRFWILACRWIPPMAPVSPRRSARDRARLASQGMEGLLAMAVAARNARRAASYRGGTVCPHPEDGCGESPLGATPRPGRARTVRVPGVGADCRHWACDFFSVRTIFFQTLHIFFVMHHETREILQARVTRHPTAEWAAQQIVAACGWERDPPRYLIRSGSSSTAACNVSASHRSGLP